MIAQEQYRAKGAQDDKTAHPPAHRSKTGWDGAVQLFGETHSNTNGFWSSIGTTLAQNQGAWSSETQLRP